MNEITESLTVTIKNPLAKLVMTEVPSLPEESKPKGIPPPPNEINEIRSIRIGGFSFKVGRRKTMSRTTGKRKDPNKVRQGKKSYRAHRSRIQQALRRWRKSSLGKREMKAKGKLMSKLRHHEAVQESICVRGEVEESAVININPTLPYLAPLIGYKSISLSYKELSNL